MQDINQLRAEARERGRNEARQRVKAIVTHPAAEADYEFAKRLALETDLPAAEAIERLQARETEAVVARAAEIVGKKEE